MCMLYLWQEVAQYRFNPMASTHDQIREFSLNASFYTLAGASRQGAEMFVESLLVEVCILMNKLVQC